MNTAVRLLLSGAALTLKMTVSAALIGGVAAVIAGQMRLAQWPAARWLSTAFIEVFRGTSVYVQLFWAYFVLPFLGIEISAFAAGVLVLGLNAGAFGAEVWRGALLAVPREQREACVALNLSPAQTYSHVLVPQVLLIALPSMSNYCIEIVKSTAVVSLISLADITYNAQVVRAQTGHTAQPFLLALLLYFVINSGIAAAFDAAERHLSNGVSRTSEVTAL